MRKTLYQLLLVTCLPFSLFAQQHITISGFVREKGSMELLPGVNVYLPNSTTGTLTNTYGFYSITIPKSDSVSVSYSFVGYAGQELRIPATADQQVNVTLSAANQLDEVLVSGRRQDEKVSESVQMSQIEVPIAQIKKIPAFFGEKDVIRVLQLMPGVQKGTEGQTGLYVRGGGPDQNLIILDDAVVYNASHLFGFFSVFNSDALKSVELTKGGFPARYGGRLSSVVEMNMKEGSKEKLHGEGGIGLISSRLTLEGPLARKKSSFLISARRTYIDVLAAPLIAQQQTGYSSKVKPGYFFYDLNAKVNYDFGPKNKVYLSGYFGQDRFHIREKSENSENRSGLNWGNATATLRWNHLINQKLFVNTSLIYSHFNFNIFSNDKDFEKGQVVDEFSLKYNSLIRDYSLKTDFDYYLNAKHSIKFGAQVTSHRFVPSALALEGDFTEEDIDIQAQPINTLEAGAYVEDTWQPFTALKLNAGFRLSLFQTKTKTYVRPEPRFSAAWKLATDFSMKASYANMNQYVHLLSNTGLGLPTDLWVPTTDKVAPQQSSQVAFGFAKDLQKPGLALTLEGYYKNMNNIISYKEGSSFISLDGDNANELNWEDNVTSGKGWSYGAEFMVQKKSGKLSGWVGYTLSWTKWKFPELNFGETFYPRYDRRNDISVVGIYELSKRITLSATWVYGTGNALTLPVSKYSTFGNHYVSNLFGYPGSFGNVTTEYGKKNSFRAEPYHRMDVAIQFHKKKKRHERTWEFGLYNAYNRRNPFFYNLDTKEDKSNPGQRVNVLTRYSLFPVLPSFSYNFKF
ncbi:TonB-dependent receptor [Dyadobacter sp. CY323]|uniref:TonB-dependent receptor n=1 Tax=Dyadobacter sp. CY323 TaxID=2907302 RepID=UPI001F1D06CB|nr:TonB-dependent receptor [Dyadobacter sp. CY323]MCE6987940.1 TonB-dependent receptor [Dyadobacter sp. CY323]